MRILYLAYAVVVNGCNLIGSALPQPLAQILHLRTRWFNPSQLVLVAFFLHPLASALCDGGVIQYVSDQTTRTHTYFIWHVCAGCHWLHILRWWYNYDLCVIWCISVDICVFHLLCLCRCIYWLTDITTKCTYSIH